MENKRTMLLSLRSFFAKEPIAKAWNHLYEQHYSQEDIIDLDDKVETVNSLFAERYHGDWVDKDIFRFKDDQSLMAFMLAWGSK
jgi:phosphopantetheinyl transferase (holo-ACP synthase)